MAPNNYPRPPYVSGPYHQDKTWGIVIIVLSSLCACGGLILGALGGVVGAIGAGAAASGTHTRDGQATAAMIGAGGGILAIVGFAIAFFQIVQIVGGVGVMKSQRWGFVLTTVFAALSALSSLANLPHGLFGLALNSVILWYCISRLSGKMGPAPL